MSDDTLENTTDAAAPDGIAGADDGNGDGTEPGTTAEVTEVAAVAYDELTGGAIADGPARDVGLLAGIEVEVSVELGRSRLPLRQLLSLAPGAVVDLDRAAGSAVEILVNGTTVARGEVVVVDGDFGVRVTEILRR